MLVFVYGGSGSGKSAFAERLIVESGFARRVYLATMEPYGEEARERIARHRALRAGKGFETVERPSGLSSLPLPPGCAALLEDLTNLFANEWFGVGRVGAAARVRAGLERLASTAALAVVVGTDIFSDGAVYDREPEAFLSSLSSLHRELAARAGQVYEGVCGIPIRL